MGSLDLNDYTTSASSTRHRAAAEYFERLIDGFEHEPQLGIAAAGCSSAAERLGS